MSIFQTFKLAAESIIGSKMRSFLTMLGMIIGVFSVITLVGLMNGVTNYVISTFDEMGTNTISVSVTNTDTRVVDVDDVYEFVDENSSIFDAVSPNVSGNYTVKNGTTSETESVTGVGEDYLDMNELTLASGRFVQYSDIKNRYQGCVIGSYIVDEIFDGVANVGDTMKIDGNVYTIIGILEEQADSEENSTDDCIYIPYSTATRLAKSTSISSYTFTTVDSDYIDAAKTLLDSFLYGILKNEDLYNISTMAELLETMNEMIGKLSLVLYGIAGISLLVAGVGIMNIMLVSVVERTKEIGIRKSLGAKRRDIMLQFVIEAGAISSFGGVLGIVLGWAITTSLGNLFGVDAAPGINATLLAFGVSAGIGIGFGYAPANKASKLNPIDALRND